jgi:hypothetical protein
MVADRQHCSFAAGPYRKNDQAYVEQKNGAVVRRLVGYRRLAGLAAGWHGSMRQRDCL